MGIFAWIVVGAIAGYVATLILGENDGIIVTILLGIVGGLVGGYLATTVFKIGVVDGINLESIVIAIAGALIVIVTWHALVGRRTGRARL
jgi:uncharacterized membrane protein YeaQ/YmgE (transglycosylase-associated protein family)